MSENKKRKTNLFCWEMIAIFLFFMITFVFFFVRKENIYIQTWDNLDSNIPWLKMLKDSGLFFSADGALPFLGGASRRLMGSELKFYNLLYAVFSPYTAMITGWYLKLMMSIWGFHLLGKQLFCEYDDKKGTVLFCGLLYGLLPTFPTAAFSFASLPLLLYLIIELHREKKLKVLWLLFFYPMLSSAATFGVFACGYILIAFLIDWIVNRKPAWRMLAAVFILGMGYMLTEWRLFYSMLFSGEESIRATFVLSQTAFAEMLNTIYTSFKEGQNHAVSLHKDIVLRTCVIYFVILNCNYLRKKNYRGLVKDIFNWLMVWLGFNCIICGTDEWDMFRQLVSIILPPLKGFSFSRTIWFNPFIWYFSFMIVLCRITKVHLRTVMVLLAFYVICVNPAPYNHLQMNITAVAHELSTGTEYSGLTYYEFYSEDLFQEIKEDIGYEGEWSIAFGMHPGVLQYNGIATLDGYLSTYPAEYKYQFRKLIEPNFITDKVNEQYFDDWGGRAYIFSDEITYEPVREMMPNAAEMKIDPDVFREMQGKYVFSRVEITNIAALGLEKVGIYEHTDSPYTIYVYQTCET